MNRISLLMLILLFVSSCNGLNNQKTTILEPIPSPPVETSPSNTGNTNSKEQNLTTEPTKKPIITSIPISVVNANHAIVKRCPSQGEMQLSDLGLKDSTRLIVTDFGDIRLSELWLMNADQNTNPFMKNIEGSFILQVSPTKEWVGDYIRVQKEDSFEYNLWIHSPLDNARIFVHRANRPLNYMWTNNETIVVIDREASAPTYRIHPFNMETISLEPVIIDIPSWQFTFDPTGTMLVYLPPSYTRPNSWKLFDYSTGKEMDIFPGTNVRRMGFPPDVSVSWKSGAVSLGFMDDYNLELAINILPETLQKVSFPTHKITFPDKSNRRYFIWWSSDNRLLAFERYLEDIPEETSKISQFFILDTVEWVLYDYCLDPGSIYFSADERFMATIPKDSINQRGTMIVELETGNRAWIDDIRVAEWAEVK